MKRRTGFVAWLTYAVVRWCIFVFHSFPLDWNLRTARLMGWVWWVISPRHRNRTIGHVRLAYGSSMSEEEVQRVARRSMQHLVMLVMEMLFTPRIIGESTWRQYVDVSDLSEAMEVLLKGRGAVLVTGHYGNWELTGHLLSLMGFEVVALMRPLDNVYLNRYLVETRRAGGLQLLDKKGAMDSAEEILARGGALAFIADQDAGRKGLFVDFFGVQASTYKSIGLLAMQAEAPIIVGCARRIGDRFQYELKVERVIQPAEWRDRDDALHWITQEYTSALERAVRRDPTQYLWIHRRWKSRPKSERRLQVGVT